MLKEIIDATNHIDGFLTSESRLGKGACQKKITVNNIMGDKDYTLDFNGLCQISFNIKKTYKNKITNQFLQNLEHNIVFELETVVLPTGTYASIELIDICLNSHLKSDNEEIVFFNPLYVLDKENNINSFDESIYSEIRQERCTLENTLFTIDKLASINEFEFHSNSLNIVINILPNSVQILKFYGKETDLFYLQFDEDTFEKKKLSLNCNCLLVQDKTVKLLTEIKNNNISIFCNNINNHSFINSDSAYEKIMLHNIKSIKFTNNKKFSCLHLIISNCNNVNLEGIENKKIDCKNIISLNFKNCNFENIFCQEITYHYFDNLKFNNLHINNDKHYLKTINGNNQEEIKQLLCQQNEICVADLIEDQKGIKSIISKGIKKISVTLHTAKEIRVILLEDFCPAVLSETVKITLTNFSKSNILFLPKKENSLISYLLAFENLSIFDLYNNKKLNITKLNLTPNNLSRFSYIENQLRINKHIKLANKYAGFCEEAEFIGWGGIEKLWQWSYYFGYTPVPVFRFFIIQIAITLLMTLAYYCSIDKSDYVYFILDSINPFFKMTYTPPNGIILPAYIKPSIYLANVLTAINIIGLGVSLKRKFSRNTS